MRSFRQSRCLVIAEIGQAHDGSLDFAHAYIESAARAGADGVKFQTHLAAEESTPREPWRARFSRRDETRYEYWRRMELSEAEWLSLRRHAADKGLWFISSPFSVAAVELLGRIEVDALKVASGEVGHGALLDALVAEAVPVVLSTGMSSWHEIDAAVERLSAADVPLAVLQCTSRYPTQPEQVGLNVIDEMRHRYPHAAVGLSDHSGTIFAGLAAMARGIDMLEVHLVLSRDAFSPDRDASVTPDELRQLCEGAKACAALATPVDKDAMAEGMSDMRAVFTRSIVARLDLPAGHRLTADDVVLKKPGTGLPPDRIDELLGRRLHRAVAADEPLSPADVAE